MILRYKTYITLLIAAILIGGIGILNSRKYTKLEKGELTPEQFWVLKAKQANYHKYNVVVIGDSRTYRGVSPAAMNTVLPSISIYNFGFSSGGLNKEMFIATEQLLDGKAKNRAIVIGITPSALEELNATNTQYRQELYRSITATWERLYLLPYLNLFDRLELQYKRGNQPLSYTNRYYDDGWVASSKQPEDTTEALQPYQEEMTKYPIVPKYVNDLLRQINQWRSQSIKVFAFRPPTTKAMLDLENELSQFDEQSFVKRFEQAGGHWIEVDRAQYHSYDGSHIDSASAVKLSKFLANEIKHAGY